MLNVYTFVLSHQWHAQNLNTSTLQNIEQRVKPKIWSKRIGSSQKIKTLDQNLVEVFK